MYLYESTSLPSPDTANDAEFIPGTCAIALAGRLTRMHKRPAIIIVHQLDRAWQQVRQKESQLRQTPARLSNESTFYVVVLPTRCK
jgi:hypothetical protein